MAESTTISGHGAGDVDVVISVDDVAKQAAELAQNRPDVAHLESLTKNKSFLEINNLHAGYGRMEILHDFNLRIGKGQSLCLIGPNGAGKSTILHSIYGFCDIMSGKISAGDKELTNLSPNTKLSKAGIAYVLQDNSVFPDLTVEENLLMGGYLLNNQQLASTAADKIFSRYDRLAKRKNQRAGVLSGGERRLLEISRALIMEPDILLIDEPSIGLEPRFINMVFEILTELKEVDGKTIIMVEQNAKKGLEFADIGYVLVSGELAMAEDGNELLKDPAVGRLFLGG